MSKSFKSLADKLSAFTDIGKREDVIYESGKSVEVSKDVGSLLTILWKATDILNNIEAKYHYAVKGTLGGTGHPYKDKRAREKIEGTYAFVKQTLEQLNDVKSKIAIFRRNAEKADAEIAAMFGEEYDRSSVGLDRVEEGTQERALIDKGRDVSNDMSKIMMKGIEKIPGVETRDFLKADGWGHSSFVIEEGDVRYPAIFVVQYNDTGKKKGKYFISFEVQTPLSYKWDTGSFFLEAIDDALSKTHMAIKGSGYGADRWSKVYMTVPEDEMEKSAGMIAKKFPVFLAKMVKEDGDDLDGILDEMSRDKATSRAKEIGDEMDKLDAMIALKKSYEVAKKLPSIRESEKAMYSVKRDLDELMWKGYTDDVAGLLHDADRKLADFVIVQAAITRKSAGKK